MNDLSVETFESEISKEERTRIRSAVRELSKLSPVKSFGAILGNWFIVIACISLALWLNHILISIAAILTIGARQHALLLIMHDGSHSRLSNNRKLNLLISDFFCAFPLLITTTKYRDSHLAHHQYLNTDKDPDWMLKKGLPEWEFPKSRIYMTLLFLKHLLGLTTFNFIGKLYRFGVKNKTATKHAAVSKEYKFVRLAYYIILILSLTYFKIWTVFLLYWMLPAFTVLPFLLRLRSLAEHFGLPWQHELNSSRNVVANFLESFFLVAHSASYHLDHHLYPSVPFYNLKKLHRVLMENSFYAEKATNTKSYLLPTGDSVIDSLTK